MQEARRTSEALARSLIKAVSDAVVALDRDGKLLFMNPVAEEMCGVSTEAVVGMHIDKVFPMIDPDTKSKLPCPLDKILNDEPLELVRPSLLINAMGKEILVRRRAAPTHDFDGQITGAVFVLQDLSPDQNAEHQHLRADNPDSTGLQARGIGHDLNNAFTGIIGNLSLLKEHPSLPPETKARLTLIEGSAQKARQLTLQLLTLAKRGSTNP